jgi:hypothetical protein
MTTTYRRPVEAPTPPDDMSDKDLAALLTDAINADVWTDAQECHQQLAIIQDAMAEAAHRLVNNRLAPETDALAVADARSMYADDELRVDEGAQVIFTDKGKWVAAWVFVEN